MALGADPAMMERASAQHARLLIASTQNRQEDKDTKIYPLLSDYTPGEIQGSSAHSKVQGALLRKEDKQFALGEKKR